MQQDEQYGESESKKGVLWRGPVIKKHYKIIGP